jgi:hypothetical protein
LIDELKKELVRLRRTRSTLNKTIDEKAKKLQQLEAEKMLNEFEQLKSTIEEELTEPAYAAVNALASRSCMNCKHSRYLKRVSSWTDEFGTTISTTDILPLCYLMYPYKGKLKRKKIDVDATIFVNLNMACSHFISK